MSAENNHLFAHTGDLLAHAGWVRALAARLARDEAEAEDAAQDALASALTHPPLADRPLRPWLGRVLGNALRARRRSQQRRAEHEAAAARERAVARTDRDDDAAELAQVLEEQRRLSALVAELPEPFRATILARYYRGESAAAIARRTGVNAATVRSRMQRAHALLRERFAEELRVEGRGDPARALVLAAGGGQGMAISTGTAGASALALQGVLVMQTGTKILLGAAAAVLLGALFLQEPWSSRRDAMTSARAEPDLPPELVLDDAPEQEPQIPGELSAEVLGPSNARSPIEAPGPAPTVDAGPPPTLVTARLIGADAGGLSGATLAYAEPSRPDHHETSTAAELDGKVTLALKPGAVRMWGNEPMPSTFIAVAPGHALKFFRASVHPEESTDLGVIELQPGGAVSGVVLDENGVPVLEARVIVSDPSSAGDDAANALAGPRIGLGLPEGRSRADGSFHIGSVAAGPARVWARIDDGPWAVSEIVTVPARGATTGLHLRIPPSDGEAWIRGLVLDHRGAPVPEAALVWCESGYLDVRKETADATGAFRLRAERDTGHVLFAAGPEGSKLGYGLLQGARPGEEVELRLNEPRVMSVLILDEEGDPIPGASPAIGLEDGLLRSVFWRLTTFLEPTQDGYVARIPPAPFRIEVNPKGFASTRSELIDPKTAPAQLELRLTRESSITGTVTHEGSPIAGVKVTTCSAIEGWSLLTDGFLMRYDVDMVGVSATTDERGRFELPSQRSQYGHWVIADASGYAVADAGPFVADGAPLSGVELELVRGGTIEGRLRFADGANAEGQLIAASAGAGRIHHVRTDAEGRFRLEHLRPGPWWVEHRLVERERSWTFAEDDPASRPEPTCTVRDGSVTKLDLSGRREVRLLGRLTVDGEPAVDWSATLDTRAGVASHDPRIDRESASRTALVDSDGSFELLGESGLTRLVLQAPPGNSGEVTTLFSEIELRDGLMPWSAEFATGTMEVRAGSAGAILRLHTSLGDQSAWTRFRIPAGSARTIRAPVGAGTLSMEIPQGDWKNVTAVQIGGDEPAVVSID